MLKICFNKIFRGVKTDNKDFEINGYFFKVCFILQLKSTATKSNL